MQNISGSRQRDEQRRTVRNVARNGTDYWRSTTKIRVCETVQCSLLQDLEQILGDLAQMGFNAEWGVLRADTIGAYHRREQNLRWWPTP